jgi:hypothetical protein
MRLADEPVSAWFWREIEAAADARRGYRAMIVDGLAAIRPAPRVRYRRRPRRR